MNERSGPCRLVHTDLAALAVGMTQATIRKWASRGKITRYGTPGRALYDLCELLDITTEVTDRSCSGLCPESVRRPIQLADRS